MASISSFCLAFASLVAADCEAPSSSKALLQSKVHVEDSEHGTVDKSGACDYDVYLGRNWVWDKHWAKRIVPAPKGETFHFDGCREDAGCGSGGIHVLRDSNGNEVGTGTCCSGLTNKVLRVISNACTDKCLYTLDIYRGGPNNFAKWFQKNSTKPRGETFAFTGCITDTGNGQKCVTDYNVADGIRYYTDFIGNRIGTGSCCDSETDKVEIADEHSLEEDEEDTIDVVPSERSYPRLSHPRRKLRAEKQDHVTIVADPDSDDDNEESHLVAGHGHAHHHGEMEERSKITVWAASSNLVTCMVGASVLSLPRMVANNGWALGPAMVLLAGFVSYQAACMVDQAIDLLADAGHHPKNIGDVVQECFGYRGRRAVLFLTCIFQISKCGVYFVVIGANLNYAMDAMSSRQWALVGAALCMRLMFVQDISVISQWSFIGVLASGLYLLTISAGGVEAAAIHPSPTKTWPNTYSNLLADFAVMVYAYSPCDVLPVLKHDMKEPKHLHQALRLSFFTVVFIYVSLGSVAFLGWGNHVGGNVLLSMCDPPGCPGNLPAKVDVPGKKWLLGYCLAGAVVSNLMVTAPVVLYCVFRVLENEHAVVTHPLVNGVLRVATVTIAVLIALFLPHFTEILAVISTGLLTVLQVFVPVAVTLALRGFGFRVFLLSVLGTGMLTAGMSSALRNLYKVIAEG